MGGVTKTPALGTTKKIGGSTAKKQGGTNDQTFRQRTKS